MVDIARLYHPAYSNDPRILPWCAALPEVSDCSSASVTPARAQCRCRSRVKAQIDAEGPARRRRRSRPLPGATGWPERSTSAPPRPAHGRHHPTAPARRRLVASRQPWALSVLPIRNGSSRTGRGPEQAPIRTSSTRLAGEPAHRSATRPGATAHRRTPEPLRRARHSARTARPEASAHDRTRVTSAVTIDILLRPTATEPDRHETAWRSPCPAPTATPGPHRPTPTCPAPTSRGCRRHRDDRDHRRPTRPCRRR